jgi:hypothetical protein
MIVDLGITGVKRVLTAKTKNNKHCLISDGKVYKGHEISLVK